MRQSKAKTINAVYVYTFFLLPMPTKPKPPFYSIIITTKRPEAKQHAYMHVCMHKVCTVPYIHTYMLSSLHRLRVFFHASRSPMPSATSMPTPRPRSTHSLLPISERRERARVKANSSSSPLKTELDLRSDTERPSSSSRLRTTSGSSAAAAASLVAAVVVSFLSSFLDKEDFLIKSLMSDSERKRFFRGTAVVRTSFACGEEKISNLSIHQV